MTDYAGVNVNVNSVSFGTRAGSNVGGIFVSTVTLTITVYQNRVYDTVAGSFVTWNSNNAPDSSGTSYPGPGTFGVNTSDFIYRILGQNL